MFQILNVYEVSITE